MVTRTAEAEARVPVQGTYWECDPVEMGKGSEGEV